MTIPSSDFLATAEGLPVGGRTQVAHSCGSGNKLLVEHKPHGYTAWCYRCNDAGWVPKRMSLAERIEALNRKAGADKVVGSSSKPPMPSEFDIKEWPDEAKVWLYKAGFDNDWIGDMGLYYSPPSERVVMPVIGDDGRLVFWQARGFDPARPKYISPALEATAIKPTYKAFPSRPVEGYRPDILCLTEDILSANKVGQVVTGWSLLGTALTPLAEAQIAKFGASEVLVWLDPDDAGVKARRRIVPQLRALGVNARAVRADLDPKLYPLDEIRRKLL